MLNLGECSRFHTCPLSAHWPSRYESVPTLAQASVLQARPLPHSPGSRVEDHRSQREPSHVANERRALISASFKEMCLKDDYVLCRTTVKSPATTGSRHGAWKARPPRPGLGAWARSHGTLRTSLVPGARPFDLTPQKLAVPDSRGPEGGSPAETVTAAAFGVFANSEC